MKKTALRILLSFSLASAATPGFAFACGQPCTRSQAQMLACAKACALAQDGAAAARIGRPDCTWLDLSAAAAFVAPSAPETSAPAPAFGFPAADRESAPAQPSCKAADLRGPPSPSPQASAKLPASHAPPALN